MISWTRKPHRRHTVARIVFLLAGIMPLVTSPADAGSYMFNSLSVNMVTHPTGYDGAGGTVEVTVGINPTSQYAAQMEIPVRNIINTLNLLRVTTGNLVAGSSNEIPASSYDFESVALHELGHALGLSHPNLATESGLSGSDQNYTKTTRGTDNSYTLDMGPDAVRGSNDDLRGDDINLNWFKTADNNPFTIAAVVDATSYSRIAADLPAGHAFVANAERSVGAALGYPDTEAVMQQGTWNDEAQRTLAAEDVAALRYAMAGLDEIAGTDDDYQFHLSYAGLTTEADIVITFDGQSGFAVTSVSGGYLRSDHMVVTSADISFDSGYNWYFNDVLHLPDNTGPCNEALLLLLLEE